LPLNEANNADTAHPIRPIPQLPRSAKPAQGAAGRPRTGRRKIPAKRIVFGFQSRGGAAGSGVAAGGGIRGNSDICELHVSTAKRGRAAALSPRRRSGIGATAQLRNAGAAVTDRANQRQPRLLRSSAQWLTENGGA
jgi:hypothetical protein